MSTSLYRRWLRWRRNDYLAGAALVTAASALALFVSWVVLL